MDSNGAAEFWQWFSSVADRLGERLDNPRLLKLLDRKIQELGPFAWEVGPGEMAASALTISPGGDPALLAQTRALVAAAPVVPGWELYCAKRAKALQGDLEFEMEGSEGRTVSVNASAWRFVRLRYPDGFVELLVEAKSLPLSIDGDWADMAAEIAVDSLIGEEERLAVADKIAVVRLLEERHAARSKPLTDIRSLVATGGQGGPVPE